MSSGTWSGWYDRPRDGRCHVWLYQQQGWGEGAIHGARAYGALQDDRLGRAMIAISPCMLRPRRDPDSLVVSSPFPKWSEKARGRMRRRTISGDRESLSVGMDFEADAAV